MQSTLADPMGTRAAMPPPPQLGQVLQILDQMSAKSDRLTFKGNVPAIFVAPSSSGFDLLDHGVQSILYNLPHKKSFVT